jgi:hypothetical protein
MTIFTVTEPFGVDIFRNDRGRLIRKEEGKKFFKNHRKHKESTGCYLFCKRVGGGILPYYIGKSTTGFENEVFNSDNREKYSQVVVEYGIGTPVLIFVVHPVKPGLNNNGHIKELENFLIYYGKKANPRLLNVQNIGSAKINDNWGIKGVHNCKNAHAPKNIEIKFRKMMGL